MSQPDLFPAALPPAPDRKAGLSRLKAFPPAMGRAYASARNFDLGPQDRSNISCLSAHVRHRLVQEAELAQAALSAHGLQAAEKFIQEVCWRTYWKGWLELRSAVWADYKAEREQAFKAVSEDQALAQRYEAAIEGRTGLEGFDAWATELMQTGYLHNHARMWFASIWIFTLDLPWVLGADHFLRHLIDGDAASNTLSWRWVGGLQTVGKTYLARASNIEKYTKGRFAPDPASLAPEAPALPSVHPVPSPGAILPGERPDPSLPSALWLHDEDLHAESWGVEDVDIRCVIYPSSPASRGEAGLGEVARRFSKAALEDGAQRAAGRFGVKAVAADSVADQIEAARSSNVRQLITQRPCQGGVRDERLKAQERIEASGLRVVSLTRDWDQAFHPFATKGFFKFKTAIPDVFTRLGLN